MDTNALLQALGSGLLALLGGYTGAALARRTEYEKWLRQEKGKAFADLLSELHETRLAASNAMYDTSVPEHLRSIRANELYARFRKYVSVARLYMSEENRARLERQIDAIWLNATSNGGPADYAVQIRQHMRSVQELLEQELHLSPSRFSDRPKL